jgi:hypothetical protein
MRALASAILAFSVLIFAHLMVWRVRKPASEYTSLSALCLAVVVFSLAGFYAIQPMISGSVRFLPVTLFDYANFVMLYIALALSYLITYSAVQADSPTMTILLRIERAGPKGLSLEEMVAELNDHVLVAPRLEDLVTGNLVGLHGGRYVVDPRGAYLAKTYIFFRALLKMEKGG